MGQQRLNNLMVLHVHRDRTDLLNLVDVASHPLWPASWPCTDFTRDIYNNIWPDHSNFAGSSPVSI